MRRFPQRQLRPHLGAGIFAERHDALARLLRGDFRRELFSERIVEVDHRDLGRGPGFSREEPGLDRKVRLERFVIIEMVVIDVSDNPDGGRKL